MPEAIKEMVILTLFTLAESTGLLLMNEYSVFRLITLSGENEKGDVCKNVVNVNLISI